MGAVRKTAGHKPSVQQARVYKWMRKAIPGQKQHCIVRARAGTGKTTTAVAALDYAPETDIFVAAFNGTIAKELKTRITNPVVQVSTIHSFGNRIVSDRLGRFKILDKDALRSRADILTDAIAADHPLPPWAYRLVSRLHTAARERLPLATAPDELMDLAFELDCDIDDDYGPDTGDLCAAAIAAMDKATDTKLLAHGMDFADMLFLPLRLNLIRPMFNLVVIDEAQDWTTAQLLMATRACRPDGRIILFGDDRQGIYGFRGADTDALDRLKRELDADELPLTTTYRCGKTIVAYAQRLVPDFKAGPNNPDGAVTKASRAQMMTDARPGDFIISRKNAPLIKVAKDLLKAGKRAKMRGRDVGQGLIRLVAKIGRGSSNIDAFLVNLQDWADTRIQRALAADQLEKAAMLVDDADTLRTLADDCTSVPQLTRTVTDLFADTGAGDADVIVCTSIHKAKGLEANRVFVMTDTLYPAGVNLEEQNLEYVAVTRAKQELVLVA